MTSLIQPIPQATSHYSLVLLRLAPTTLSSCFLLLPSSSPLWPLSGLLSILVNTGFSAFIVALNSHLPRRASSSLPSSDHGDTEKLSLATACISSLGIALGCTADILLLFAVLFPVQLADGSIKALWFAIAGSGALWALFSVPALLFLPGASSPQEILIMEQCEGLLAQERPKASGQYVLAQYPAATQHVPSPRRMVPSFRWLHTLTSSTLPFAKTTLHMPLSSLILLGILAPSAEILDALVWPAVRRLQLNSLCVLMLLVVAASLIPLYGVIGLFAPRGAK
ncbi:autophagy-related protein 22-like protein [Lactarius quietus]|nr:autophagy-related protein 22-like protein [Lactarius quietus]